MINHQKIKLNVSASISVTAKHSKLKCQCGECESEGNYYKCVGCKRPAPHCMSYPDEYYEYCDECWYEITNPELYKQDMAEQAVSTDDYWILGLKP